MDKKSLKMPKTVHLKNWSLWSNGVTRQVNFNETKIGGKCQAWKSKMRHFWWFSNTVRRKTLLVDRSEFSILNIRPYCWCKDIPLRTSAWMSNAHVGWNTRSEKKVPGFSGSKFLISLMIGVLVPSMNFYQLVDIFAQSLLWN